MNQSKLFPTTLMPDNDWWHALWPNPSQVLQDVGITAGMDVVDLCCGDGHFTKPMCQLVHPGKTWALDLDADQLSQAEQGCEDNPNFHVILGDARELQKLIKEPVDFVFIANTFHGVPDKRALSEAVHESLKPDGHFAIINWYRLPREVTIVLDQPRGPDTKVRMEPEEVKAHVELAGFKLEKVVDVSPYHYGAIFCKSENRKE